MKANELRLGNLVLYSDKNETPIPTTINIDISDLILLNNSVKDVLYEPIPLTEEWLLKFGFEKKEGYYDRYYYSIDGMNIKIDDDMFETEVGECLYKSIKYVHQLQNLFFAINDEELTMK